MANRPTGEGTMNTLVGSGTSLEGALNVASSVRVDGKVKGQITCSETLLVGKTGEVEASVKVKSATIGGKVVGDIVAEEVVVLESKSTLVGDVTTKKLIIEEGALFNGTCRMGEEVRRPETGQRQEQQVLQEQSAASSGPGD